jgi:hypothetical protein
MGATNGSQAIPALSLHITAFSPPFFSVGLGRGLRNSAEAFCPLGSGYIYLYVCMYVYTKDSAQGNQTWLLEGGDGVMPTAIAGGEDDDGEEAKITGTEIGEKDGRMEE